MQREIKSATEKGRERMARCEKACERGVFGKNNKLTYFLSKHPIFHFDALKLESSGENCLRHFRSQLEIKRAYSWAHSPMLGSGSSLPMQNLTKAFFE